MEEVEGPGTLQELADMPASAPPWLGGILADMAGSTIRFSVFSFKSD